MCVCVRACIFVTVNEFMTLACVYVDNLCCTLTDSTGQPLLCFMLKLCSITCTEWRRKKWKIYALHEHLFIVVLSA